MTTLIIGSKYIETTGNPSKQLLVYSEDFPKKLVEVEKFDPTFDFNSFDNWMQIVEKYRGTMSRVIICTDIVGQLKWNKKMLLLLAELLTKNGMILLDSSFMFSEEWFKSTHKQIEDLKARYNVSEPEKFAVDGEIDVSELYSFATYKEDVLATVLYDQYNSSSIKSDQVKLLFQSKGQIISHNIKLFNSCGFEIGSEIAVECGPKCIKNPDMEKLIKNSEIIKTYDVYPMISFAGYPVKYFELSKKITL